VEARGGLGIGLTLVKQLVSMHRGSIEVRSQGEGHGIEFIVRLPVPEPGAQPVAEAQPIGTHPVTEWPPARRHRVLVVDDNRDAVDSLALLLELWGNEAHVARDGAEAFDAAMRLHPDVVLLDIGLPDMSGLDVCRRIRAEEWGKEMVLLALTGWGQEEDRRQSTEAGFDGHFVKPVDHDVLEKYLRELQVRGTPEAPRSASGTGPR
jgi:CheY-like chemotaxis protein